MAKFAVLLITVLAASTALAAVTRRLIHKTQLEEIGEQVQTVTKDVSASLQKMLPDAKQVSETLVAQSKQFASNVENIVDKMQDAIDRNTENVNKILEQVAKQLSQAYSTLRDVAGVDVSDKAKEIRVQLEANVKDAIAELENLAKQAQSNVQEAQSIDGSFAKGIIDVLLKAAKNLQAHVQSVIQANKPT